MYNRFISSSFSSLPLFFYHLNKKPFPHAGVKPISPEYPHSRFEQSLSAMGFIKKPCQTKRLRDTTLHTFARESLFLQLSWEYGEQITYSSKDHGFQ